MAPLRSRRLLLPLLLLALSAPTRGDELSAAYSAILKGDYAAGKTAVDRLRQSGLETPEVLKVDDWLERYGSTIASRDELRSKTFDWNVEQARKAAEAGRTYLALSFLNQARYYASEPEALVSAEWVRGLVERARGEAEALRAGQKWTKLYSYYALLSRLYPENEEYEQALRDAERHARLEFVYKDREAVKRRTEGVDERLLPKALAIIDSHYYEQPDFRELAEGAVRNLLIMCETPKLYDVFDGLANPDFRGPFVAALRAKQEELQRRDSMNYRQVFKLYEEIKQKNRETVSLPDAVLVMEFLEGVVTRLDPFSDMIWPVDVKEFAKQVMGNFHGVGIQLGIDETTNRLKVVTPLEGSPALSAGVRPGDLIIKVNGESTAGWTTDDAVRNITGPAGTKVVVTMHRPSTGQDIDFELVRAEINLRTVFGVNRTTDSDGRSGWNYMLDADEGIAYIRLSNFNRDSQAELDAALRAARQQGMKALVLDLRFNPGGLLEVAISTVSTFLREGEVVSTRGRRDPGESARVDGSTLFPDLPLVVLVNENSASASEILSGALQDHNRAVVIGERTFGKGSVQKVLPLGGRDDESANLRLTTALYYLPSGRTPHKRPGADAWGVEPDIEVALTPKEMRRVVDRTRLSEIIENRRGDESAGAELDEATRKQQLETLRSADPSDEESDGEAPLLSDEDVALLNSDPYEAPDVDPQLETALLMLRAKLASNLDWPRRIAARPDRSAVAAP